MSLRHYLVSGRVQGVGFRRFVEQEAQQYELSGVVRNLEDGRVEFYAEGRDENLQEFEQAIRRGPMLSVVREVVTRTLDKPEGLEEDWMTGLFKIERDGSEPWVQETEKEKT